MLKHFIDFKQENIKHIDSRVLKNLAYNTKLNHEYNKGYSKYIMFVYAKNVNQYFFLISPSSEEYLYLLFDSNYIVIINNLKIEIEDKIHVITLFKLFKNKYNQFKERNE